MGLSWDFDDDFATAVSVPQLSAEQLAAMKENERQRQFRDGEKIDTIERAREIATEMGFDAPDYVLKDLLKYSANASARRHGDNYKPYDHDMAYATRKDFDRYLAGTCAQYGIEKTQSPVLAPARA